VAYATDELLADAVALEGWLSRTVPNELRFKVEDAIYNGDGIGKPTGIMGHASLVTQLRYAASAVSAADIWAMYARRWVGARDYVWLVNQDVLPQLYALNNTYQNLFIGPSGMPNAPAGTLMGLPIVEVEYAATMGSTGDIMLAALSQYQAIEKGGIESASSIHVQFLTDETTFRFVYRFDGGPMWSSTLTPFKGSNTQSPFVVLAAATS
jgi:HK97 family phage major capsid protein